MILIVFIGASVFNFLYWISKLMFMEIGWCATVHHQYNEVMGWFVFLNFLAVISLFADTIVRWEEWKKIGQHQWRLAWMVLLVSSWGGTVLLSVLELYTLGGIQ